MRLSLLVIILFVVSCTASKEDKIKDAIEDHLKGTLNDYKSYEPVDTKIDSFYASYYNTKEASTLLSKYQEASVDYDTMTSDEVLRHLDASTATSAERLEAIDTIEARSKRFTPVFYGWRVEHKYRAKNALGATILAMDTLYFNKEYQFMDLDTLTINQINP